MSSLSETRHVTRRVDMQCCGDVQGEEDEGELEGAPDEAAEVEEAAVLAAEAEEAAENVLTAEQRSERRENEHGTTVYYYAYWLAAMRDDDRVGQSHWRHILACSCGDVEVGADAGGRPEPFVTVALTGNGFMIHQVRASFPPALRARVPGRETLSVLHRSV